MERTRGNVISRNNRGGLPQRTLAPKSGSSNKVQSSGVSAQLVMLSG